MEKFFRVYRYIYYRLYLHHVNAWQGHKRLAKLNSSNAIAGSAVAFFGSIDLFLYSQYEVSLLLENWWLFIVLIVLILIFQTVYLPSDPETLADEFSSGDDSSYEWKLKGFLSLAFVFGPLLLLVLLAFIG